MNKLGCTDIEIDSESKKSPRFKFIYKNKIFYSSTINEIKYDIIISDIKKIINYKKPKKILGFNFFHNHHELEKNLEIEKEHVIIDKKDYELILNFFHNNKELIPYIEKDKVHWDRNTNKPFKI